MYDNQQTQPRVSIVAAFLPDQPTQGVMGTVHVNIVFPTPQRLRFSRAYKPTKGADAGKWKRSEAGEACGVTELLLRGLNVREGERGPFIMFDWDLQRSLQEDVTAAAVSALIRRSQEQEAKHKGNGQAAGGKNAPAPVRA